jgi:hypothetical protein
MWLPQASQVSLKNMDDQGIITLGDIFTYKCCGSIGLGGSLTLGIIISSINTSRTLTTTKLGGISLPPTLFPCSLEITVVVTFCLAIGFVKIILMPTRIYKRNQCQNNIRPQIQPNIIVQNPTPCNTKRVYNTCIIPRL